MTTKQVKRKKELGKILCFLGLHKWIEKQNNITGIELIFRTFLRCKRCKKWGKLIYYKEIITL